MESLEDEDRQVLKQARISYKFKNRRQLKNGELFALTVFTTPYNKNESLEEILQKKLGQKMEKEMMKMQNEMKRLIKSKEQGEDKNQNDEHGDEEESRTLEEKLSRKMDKHFAELRDKQFAEMRSLIASTNHKEPDEEVKEGEEGSNEDDGEERRGEGEKGGLASGVQVREKLSGKVRLLKKQVHVCTGVAQH